MNSQIVLIISIIFCFFIVACFALIALYVIQKYLYNLKNKLYLTRKMYLKIYNDGSGQLYNGRKIIDNNILTFIYYRFRFFLISESGKYIINSFDNKIQNVSHLNSNEKYKTVFEDLQRNLLEDVISKEAYYSKLKNLLLNNK